MKIILGHTFPTCPTFGDTWIEQWLGRLRASGFDVDGFSLAIDKHSPALNFRELDLLWRCRDRHLMAMYDRLNALLDGADAFICYNGANVHPEYAASLKPVTVYGCFDDPEASEFLSKPVAASFDICLVGNIAEIETYKSWGAKIVRWWPLGFRVDDYDPELTELAILEGKRDIDVALLCERVTNYRKQRVDQFVSAFPAGAYYGKGWPSGFLPESQRIPLLQRSKIGINIHNSTGPINFRTFYLPANGVLQICDNKEHLAGIYRIGQEVIGYESIRDAIDMTRYYLDHDDERRAIAAAGWKRALSDYNEVACFKRASDSIVEFNKQAESAHSQRQAVPYDINLKGMAKLGSRLFPFLWRATKSLKTQIRRFISR